MDCFAHVSDALVTIYKDLTKSSKHPLGGQVGGWVVELSRRERRRRERKRKREAVSIYLTHPPTHPPTPAGLPLSG